MIISNNKDVTYIDKDSIQQENIVIINIYTPSKGAPKCMKQKLTELKGDRDGSIIIFGDFNTCQ